MTPRKQCFPDITGLINIQTHRDCDRCTRPTQVQLGQNLQHKVGDVTIDSTLTKNLFALGSFWERENTFSLRSVTEFINHFPGLDSCSRAVDNAKWTPCCFFSCVYVAGSWWSGLVVGLIVSKDKEHEFVWVERKRGLGDGERGERT